MTTASGKQLLSITQSILKFASILFPIFIVIELGVLIVLIFAPEHAAIVGAYERLDQAMVVKIASSWLVGGLAICGLFLAILQRLRKIVESAATGDPFITENATRLAQIGWLLLAINIVQIVCGMVEDFFLNDVRAEFAPVSIPWTGFFSVLMILVLAQIFQCGARMRADLEGTV